jgi:hypothetical protein
MITIPVQLSEELAERVRPLRDRLPEIIELGLRQGRKQSVLTPRQLVEQLWEARGLSSRTFRATIGFKELDVNDRRQSRSEGNPPARSSSSNGARCDRRGQFITDGEYESALGDLLRDAGERYRLIAVGPMVIDSAIQLTRRQKLRGYDAIHLACALTLNKPLIDHGLPPPCSSA